MYFLIDPDEKGDPYHSNKKKKPHQKIFLNCYEFSKFAIWAEIKKNANSGVEEGFGTSFLNVDFKQYLSYEFDQRFW